MLGPAKPRRLDEPITVSLKDFVPRGAVPGMSWGERPLAWLLDVLRFVQEPPTPRWRDLQP